MYYVYSEREPRDYKEGGKGASLMLMLEITWYARDEGGIVRVRTRSKSQDKRLRVVKYVQSVREDGGSKQQA